VVSGTPAISGNFYDRTTSGKEEGHPPAWTGGGITGLSTAEMTALSGDRRDGEVWGAGLPGLMTYPYLAWQEARSDVSQTLTLDYIEPGMDTPSPSQTVFVAGVAPGEMKLFNPYDPDSNFSAFEAETYTASSSGARAADPVSVGAMSASDIVAFDVTVQISGNVINRQANYNGSDDADNPDGNRARIVFTRTSGDYALSQAADARQNKDGEYGLWLPMGTYTAEITKKGYLKMTVTGIEVSGAAALKPFRIVAGDASRDYGMISLLDLAIASAAFAANAPEALVEQANVLETAVYGVENIACVLGGYGSVAVTSDYADLTGTQ
jgi:hypothetical protein